MIESVKHVAEARQGRRFGTVLGGAFAVLSVLLWWRGHPGAAFGMAVAAAALWLGAIAAPSHLLPVERAWMALAHQLSRVTTPIVMAILYFVVFTPFGFMARAFGHHPLRRAAGQSAWIARDAARRKSDLHHQF